MSILNDFLDQLFNRTLNSNEPDETNDEERIFCEDGSEYGFNCDGYSLEYEYENELTRTKISWKAVREDGSELDSLDDI